MGTQWENFLQNLGVWNGTFTEFSPRGEWIKDTPSTLCLESFNDAQTVRLTLRRFLANPEGTGAPEVNELVRQYQSLGRDLLFFDCGAFSQGSIQLAPFSEFGAEFSLLESDRRLRLVQLYNREGQLASLTLIREQRTQENPLETPPLTLDALLGEWQGEAVTLYPDWRSPDTYPTQLKLQREGADRLVQTTAFGPGSSAKTFTSSAKIDGSILYFDQGSQVVQVLLLPGGASATSPLQLQLRKPFFLEAGWLAAPDLRLRMIRTYSETGEWVSLTLVKERKINE